MSASALLDSNVVVAAAVGAHEHHRASADLINASAVRSLAVAAHSYAESYDTLTRGGARGLFAATPAQTWAALERIRTVTALIGLTPAQTLDAVRDYAQRGGIGPRVYDRLIGETAVTQGIGVIITWNLTHMRGLFPDLAVMTPEQFAEA